MLNWLIVKKLRKFSGFKLSAFVFFIYPLLVKSAILTNFIYEEVIVIPLSIFGLESISIPLPFSLTVLYTGSIFLFLGNIFYSLLCPDPINNYNNYKDFYDEKMSHEYLASVFSPYVLDADTDIRKLNRTPPPNNIQEIFSSLYMKANIYRSWQVLPILLSFIFGFISLLIISLQNIYTSIHYICF